MRIAESRAERLFVCAVCCAVCCFACATVARLAWRSDTIRVACAENTEISDQGEQEVCTRLHASTTSLEAVKTEKSGVCSML
jgi:hypothetical protein